MKIRTSKQFNKKIAKLPPSLKRALIARLTIFIQDPTHPLLRNHALIGPHLGRRSINITGDYRLIFREAEPGLARLIDIGTHHDLYGT